MRNVNLTGRGTLKRTYHPALVAELAANEAPLHGKNSVSTNNSVSGTIPNNLGSAKSLNQLYVRVTSDLGNFNSGTVAIMQNAIQFVRRCCGVRKMGQRVQSSLIAMAHNMLSHNGSQDYFSDIAHRGDTVLLPVLPRQGSPQKQAQRYHSQQPEVYRDIVRAVVTSDLGNHSHP